MRDCKGCVAKDAHIASLQEQIEWLRLHSGTPGWVTPPTGQYEVGVAPSEPRETATWLSEEEEEIEAMRQANLITASDAAAALAQVGAFSTEVNIEG